MFDREYLKKEMEKLDGLMKGRLDFYLIGGGSMSFQNLKDATKDIDVVVRSEHDLKLLRDALVRTVYSVPAVRGPYRQMQASLIMENRDGFRWDIFVMVICGGLRLSDEFHELAYNDMVSQMILDRLEKGNVDVEELVRELGVDDIEVHLDKLVNKKLVINNGDGLRL